MPVRPFLLLATRAENAAADDEYEAMLRYGGLSAEQLTRVRLEAAPLPSDLDLDDFSGVILGGSPFNTCDPIERKSADQVRVEADVTRLLDEVVPRDFPMLGACYGIGSIGTHQGGVVDQTFGEPVSAVTVTLTAQGRADPLFADSPERFEAFVGHKEAIRTLPPSAVRLASSPGCPVQAFRVGRNIYATQYHPELDAVGIAIRTDAYADHGYFEPGAAKSLKAMARAVDVSEAPRILRAFCARYARD